VLTANGMGGWHPIEAAPPMPAFWADSKPGTDPLQMIVGICE
jgi:hypothetical protein